jgi:hypothetical protein
MASHPLRCPITDAGAGVADDPSPAPVQPAPCAPNDPFCPCRPDPRRPVWLHVCPRGEAEGGQAAILSAWFARPPPRRTRAPTPSTTSPPPRRTRAPTPPSVLRCCRPPPRRTRAPSPPGRSVCWLIGFMRREVSNYRRDPFAPGSDPSVFSPRSRTGGWGSEMGPPVRAASSTATSSIHPVNRCSTASPFDTEPVIGSESTSISSCRCVVPATNRISRVGAAPAPG